MMVNNMENYGGFGINCWHIQALCRDVNSNDEQED